MRSMHSLCETECVAINHECSAHFLHAHNISCWIAATSERIYANGYKIASHLTSLSIQMVVAFVLIYILLFWFISMYFLSWLRPTNRPFCCCCSSNETRFRSIVPIYYKSRFAFCRNLLVHDPFHACSD